MQFFENAYIIGNIYIEFLVLFSYVRVVSLKKWNLKNLCLISKNIEDLSFISVKMNIFLNILLHGNKSLNLFL
ncbi:hypothetical protein LEP1GSC024_1211 [Leptospira noguchii str. 2001034031]|uniref:Uncharacterized protein n=1 Tax=Leptospira noguchii str. 2001034031 TaxID=1193053 RepID=M6Y7U8_9LEPT|nr:hypothetical protein LEP1GSC024_1211 [Leptospira noguchii str. 2001034031]